MPTFLIKL